MRVNLDRSIRYSDLQRTVILFVSCVSFSVSLLFLTLHRTSLSSFILINTGYDIWKNIMKLHDEKQSYKPASSVSSHSKTRIYSNSSDCVPDSIPLMNKNLPNYPNASLFFICHSILTLHPLIISVQRELQPRLLNKWLQNALKKIYSASNNSFSFAANREITSLHFQSL